ncbi:hypothetical protein GCM10025794_05470 [Massilia kyonggiensis]
MSDTYDDYYRNDWNQNYSSLGGGYEDYEPAYRYGTDMRGSAKYRDRSWDEVESDLRSDWESRHPGESTWEKFKAAVRRGWDKITPDIDNDSYYRSHWNARYSNADDSYDDYLPAYRYGNEMRSTDTYRDRDWDDVEHDLRKDWHSKYGTDAEPSTWERIKAAVRHGWERMTGEATSTDDDSYYRTHWTNTYKSTGTEYDDLAPAYRYGAEMRNDVRYRNRDWSDVENDLRSDWDTRYGKDGASTWYNCPCSGRTAPCCRGRPRARPDASLPSRIPPRWRL